MNRKLKIAINITVLLALVAYMVVSIVMIVRRSDEVQFTRLDIVVEDSSLIGFIRSDSIEQLVRDSIADYGTPLRTIVLNDIEQRIESNLYVDSVEVHSSIDGLISIRLTQHRAVMRVMGEDGYDFLVDTSLNIMPPSTIYHPLLPIISGSVRFGFAPDFFGRLDVKKYALDAQNLKKLLNFVNFVTLDQFLERLCTQFYAKNGAQGLIEIEIIPSVGAASIEFGTLDECDEKLSKIKAFYRSAYSYAGLDTAKVVDVRYRNQILVR